MLCYIACLSRTTCYKLVSRNPRRREHELRPARQGSNFLIVIPTSSSSMHMRVVDFQKFSDGWTPFFSQGRTLRKDEVWYEVWPFPTTFSDTFFLIAIRIPISQGTVEWEASRHLNCGRISQGLILWKEWRIEFHVHVCDYYSSLMIDLHLSTQILPWLWNTRPMNLVASFLNPSNSLRIHNNSSAFWSSTCWNLGMSATWTSA